MPTTNGIPPALANTIRPAPVGDAKAVLTLRKTVQAMLSKNNGPFQKEKPQGKMDGRLVTFAGIDSSDGVMLVEKHGKLALWEVSFGIPFMTRYRKVADVNYAVVGKDFDARAKAYEHLAKDGKNGNRLDTGWEIAVMGKSLYIEKPGAKNGPRTTMLVIPTQAKQQS